MMRYKWFTHLNFQTIKAGAHDQVKVDKQGWSSDSI